MRVGPTSARHMGEQRRYFPDWIDRPLRSSIELEADHNSYLAGGYAEEFGYRAQRGFSRGVPLLDGENPEMCPEGCSQARALHPGYPLRAHPLASELDSFISRPGVYRHLDGSAAARHDLESHGTFAPVSHRYYERADGRRVGTALAIRFTATLLTLQRIVRSRRHI